MEGTTKTIGGVIVMSGPRDEILGRIRRSLKRSADPDYTGPAARLADRPRGIIPGRVDCDPAGLVDLFTAQAQAVDASVDRVAAFEDVPDSIATYLADHNLPSDLRVAPDPQLDGIPWDRRPTLSVSRGKTDGDDEVSITGAFAGIAETGTLMLHSGPESPTTLNYLPDTHVAVIRASQIKGAYEDGWDALRAMMKDRPDYLPRNVNFITGPSRTGDIEQTILTGAHGPRRLHIIVVDDRAA
jgi:L-lactate dehydrogenase complex protein LldG